MLVWFGTLARDEEARPGRLERLASGVSSLSETPLVLLELEPTRRSLLGNRRTGE